ncbi:hypothetical protein COV20_02010 [Candidatus Woesearchaeota archaeon CG10_big_fil_rev_8_21_14_0_10_45_16]|nr:MAG: hypothetical protein COV20_02010 [Candidatus Woesearchaeota archaeon CG10_big_fil_rev_8_21_14_0_10_45_16]
MGALGVFGLLAALGMFLFFMGIVVYVYFALALMTIAKKLGNDKAWLAWIPIANFFLLAILAEKDWPWGFLILVPLVNIVFVTIWLWKVYERRSYPGWLAIVPLLSIIPLLGYLAMLGHAIIFGFVAWSDR